MRILALDIGRRRTGVAFAEDTIGVPVALDTVQHESIDDLRDQVLVLADERNVDVLLLGMPLLLSGKEGDQSAFVRTCGDRLEAVGMHVEYMDERYSTGTRTKDIDGDAKAACELMLTYLSKRNRTA